MIEFETCKPLWERDLLAHGIRLQITPEERQAWAGHPHPNVVATYLKEKKRVEGTRRKDLDTRFQAAKATYEQGTRQGHSYMVGRLLDLGKALPSKGRVWVSFDPHDKDRYPLRVYWSVSEGSGIRGRAFLSWEADWLEEPKEWVKPPKKLPKALVMSEEVMACKLQEDPQGIIAELAAALR